jgi:hypothetical protein
MAVNVTVDTLLERVKAIAPMLHAPYGRCRGRSPAAPHPVVDAVSFLLHVSRDGCWCVVLTRM